MYRFFSLLVLPPLSCSTLFPYTTLFRSLIQVLPEGAVPATARIELVIYRCESAHCCPKAGTADQTWADSRSEEHTSELQSLRHLVCRLLLEKKKKQKKQKPTKINPTIVR